MFRLLAVRFAPLALTLLGFALQPKSAAAQTTYQFNATYIGENTPVFLPQGISQVTINALSTDAPFGLTRLVNNSYATIDPSTGSLSFSPDAATFGVNNLPRGGATFFGAGEDKLFADVVGSGKLDFQNLKGTTSGTFNIIGGEGRFVGATGLFNFLENDTLGADPTAPFKSQAVLSGSFTIPKTIPEPGSTTALIIIGIIGVTSSSRSKKYARRTLH